MQIAKIGLKLPTEGDSPDVPASRTAADWGVLAEDLGYESLWISESWGSDALLELAGVASQTTNIRLGTAIVNVYSRTPAVLAMAGVTLQRLSGGRTILGVGPSHASIIEPLHGIRYDRPVRRTHEAIELVKELTDNSRRVSYSGELFDLADFKGFDTSLPVYNAALGEANRRATGRVADGWLPYLFPISGLEEAFETIETTAREAGRDPDDIAVTPQILAAVSDDPEIARHAIRDYVSNYIVRFPNYRNSLNKWFPEEIRAIEHAGTSAGKRESSELVTIEMVEELGIAGTPEAARTRLREIADAPHIDRVIIYVPRSLSDAKRDRTIRELAPDKY